MIKSNWVIKNIIMIFDLIFTSNLYFLSSLGTKDIWFSSENIQNFHCDFSTDTKPLLFYFCYFYFILGSNPKNWVTTAVLQNQVHNACQEMFVQSHFQRNSGAQLLWVRMDLSIIDGVNSMIILFLRIELCYSMTMLFHTIKNCWCVIMHI